jgi:hypothetical protein
MDKESARSPSRSRLATASPPQSSYQSDPERSERQKRPRGVPAAVINELRSPLSDPASRTRWHESTAMSLEAREEWSRSEALASCST